MPKTGKLIKKWFNPEEPLGYWGWLAIIFFSLFFIFRITGFFDFLESKALDYRFEHFSTEGLADSNVVIVTIDQKSLDFFQDQNISWPWPREFYGFLIEYLNNAGARLVLFDIDFSQRDIDRAEVDGTESDLIFAHQLNQMGKRVVLASYLFEQEYLSIQGNQINDELLSFSGDPVPPFSTGKAYNRIIGPVRSIQDSITTVGIVNFEPDPDGILRKIKSSFIYKGYRLPQLAYAGWRNTQKSPPKLANLDEFHWIYWYGMGGPDGVFSYFSVWSIIVSQVKMMEGEIPPVHPSLFKDKYVVIGSNAPGLMDFKSTPMSSLEPYAGMEIHATILSNLLKNHSIHLVGGWMEFFLCTFFVFLVALLFNSRQSVITGFILSISVIVIYLIINALLFKFLFLSLPVASIVGMSILSLTFLGVFHFYIESNKRKSITRLFSRYLDSSIVKILSEKPEEIDLSGVETDASILFSDIKDFTTISEQLAPKELVSLLNEYLSLSSSIILQNKGMVDKYIGDAVMAIFGPPLNVKNHAILACKTAIEINQTLTNHYLTNKDYPFSIETRIGVNTGNLIIGNIGSEIRSDYTAIGDSVNTASRIEGLNKIFRTNVLISESTYQLVKNEFVARELDYIKVKGKSKPIRIYELIKTNDSGNQGIREKIQLFEYALGLYQAMNFSDAQAAFREVWRVDPTDWPTNLYIDRCNHFLHHHPGDGWDGVFTVTTK